MITSGEEQLSGVVEKHGTAVMFIICACGSCIEDELAACDGAGQAMQLAVNRERRSRFGEFAV